MIGLLLAVVRPCWGYSLLTHEEIVDILWKDQIHPLLLARYPAATKANLREAHAYAYGGSLIQDIGYYPFGNVFFSDITHYVRTGDFVANLIREATNLNEYAFGLGALAHYSSDNTGHPTINHAVSQVFPKLRAKYGDTVTFEDDPRAHIQTEFGFDITQVAKKRYTSDSFHDFIGFEISKPALEQAFLRTYGLPLEEVLGHEDLAIGTFRRAVSEVIPEMTRAALDAYHPELAKEIPDFNKEKFLYNLSRAKYETEWGKGYHRPGFFTGALSFLLRLVPKVGIFKGLAFKIPTPETEDMYLKSVNKTVENYKVLLYEVNNDQLQFANMDCDTGRGVRYGEYKLSDKTHGELLERLIKRGLGEVPPDLRTNLLRFYAGAEAQPRTRKEAKAWRRTEEEIEALKAGPDSPVTIALRKRLLAPPPKLCSPKDMGA